MGKTSQLSDALRREGFYHYQKHPKPGVCPVVRCMNPSLPDRSLCARHHTLRSDRKYPQRTYYRKLKAHAKARGIPFTLSFVEFLIITDGFDWAQYKLSQGQRMSIDRIDVTRGYEHDNCQAMKVRANIHKQHYVDYPKGEY